MDKRRRIEAALKFEPVDRLPCSCWVQNHIRGLTGAQAAAEYVRFYKEYDWDFIKIENYLPYDLPRGLDAIARPSEFDKLGPLRTNGGSYRKYIDIVGHVRKMIGKRAIVLATVCNPWATGMQIARGALAECLERWPRKVSRALNVIAENTAKLAKACLRAGANGLFYRAEGACRDGLEPGLYAETVRPLDLAVLEAASEAKFNVLNMDGAGVHFELFADYPVDVLNWDVFRNAVALDQGKRISGKCVLGGINPNGPIARGDTVEVVEEVRNAVDETDGTGLIIGPSAPVPCDVAPRDLKVIRAAVER